MKFKQNKKPKMNGKKIGRKLLSEKTVLMAQKLYAGGLSMRAVAARLCIALGSVHKIISGKHPNQTRELCEIKKEESLRLYKSLQKKKHEVCKELPPFAEISWMRVKGKKLIIESIVVIAECVNGVLRMREEKEEDRAA